MEVKCHFFSVSEVLPYVEWVTVCFHLSCWFRIRQTLRGWKLKTWFNEESFTNNLITYLSVSLLSGRWPRFLYLTWVSLSVSPGLVAFRTRLSSYKGFSDKRKILHRRRVSRTALLFRGSTVLCLFVTWPHLLLASDSLRNRTTTRSTRSSTTVPTLEASECYPSAPSGVDLPTVSQGVD